jgi:hypothetical protein
VCVCVCVRVFHACSLLCLLLGLSKGWSFLAGVLNQKPAGAKTARILYQFLLLAGHRLALAYGRQFKKLMAYIVTVYVPMLQAMTNDDVVDKQDVTLLANLAREDFTNVKHLVVAATIPASCEDAGH